MSGRDVLLEAFGRMPEAVSQAVHGLDAGQLAYRPSLPDGSGAHGNSIAWLIWHLTRVQDNHLADAAGRDELWLTDGWADRFALDLPSEDTGYGHSS
ncbi:MAG: DinB family protein, partial [Actinomycetes bacterium]